MSKLAVDMNHFFEILRTYFGALGAVFQTFENQLVVEGSTGAPKGIAWARNLKF
jgi:hypothetical protein